jgi:hypothetical protein
MNAAFESVRETEEELTQIELDDETPLLSGKLLVEAMLEIKERGASNQNICDGIDAMISGNSFFVLRRMCMPIYRYMDTSIVQRITSRSNVRWPIASGGRARASEVPSLRSRVGFLTR